MSIAVFWRAEPLTEQEHTLLDALEVAHGLSAFRNNPSSNAVMVAGAGSGNYTQSMAAALMTLGGAHAPLRATWELLQTGNPERDARDMLLEEVKVPGWGTSFIKGEPDPVWEPVAQRLAADFPQLAQKLERVTAELHRAGKLIFPNPSAYTAAVAIALGVPAAVSPYLFIASRLAAWSAIFQDSTNHQ